MEPYNPQPASDTGARDSGSELVDLGVKVSEPPEAVNGITDRSFGGTGQAAPATNVDSLRSCQTTATAGAGNTGGSGFITSPSDGAVAVSPNYILQTANTGEIVSSDKNGNNQRREGMTNFWSYYGFHADASNTYWIDVSMQWADAQGSPGGRFVMSAFNVRTNHLYIAVSKGENPDPTNQANWSTFHFLATGDRWPVLVTADKVFIVNFANGVTFHVMDLRALMAGATGGTGASYDLAQSPPNIFRQFSRAINHVHPVEPQGYKAGREISDGLFVSQFNGTFTLYRYSGSVQYGNLDSGLNIGFDSRIQAAGDPGPLQVPGGFIDRPIIGTEEQNAVVYRQPDGNDQILVTGHYACNDAPDRWCAYADRWDRAANIFYKRGYASTSGSYAYAAGALDSGLRPIIFYSYVSTGTVPIAAAQSDRFNYIIGQPTVSSLDGISERWGDYFDVQMDPSDESNLVGMATAQSGGDGFGWQTHYTRLSPSAS